MNTPAATLTMPPVGPPPDFDPLGLVYTLALAVIAVVVHVVLYAVWARLTRSDKRLGLRLLRDNTAAPTLALLIVLAISLTIQSWNLPARVTAGVLIAARFGMIAAVAWAAVRAVAVVDDVIIARNDIAQKDNLAARRAHTRARVLTRTAMVIVAVVSAALALLTIPGARDLGAGLLASAGIAGIAIGLAARPTLGNLIAGVQIALTEPINLGDAVVIEGEWGWIEEITATYVVVKIWDERRLIVPLQDVIEKPFQNWTRRRADIIGTVFLHIDYAVEVPRLRDALKAMCEDSELWDGRVCVLQVVEAHPTTMHVRALVSAADSPTAWDLRCNVREGLIEWIRVNYPDAFPRTRVDLLAPQETEAKPAAPVHTA